MRIPIFVLEHPLEALIAGLLLLVLVFGSSDRQAAEAAKAAQPHGAQLVASDRP